MFNVDYPDNLEYFDDSECFEEARIQYFTHENNSLSITRWKFECEGLDYLIDDIVDTPLPYPGKTHDQQQANREAYVRHWRPFLDAIENNDAKAVGRFILDKVNSGLLKAIEYDLIAERDARQEM